MSIRNRLQPGQPYDVNHALSKTLARPISRNLTNANKTSGFKDVLDNAISGNALKKSIPQNYLLSNDIGGLSKKFESGSDSISAIGYDPNGGTSYGTYQISSKQGTMSDFIKFLESEEPGWAQRLNAAGNSNTLGTKGKMPEVWKQIAAENPERFAALQKEFIMKNHFEPAVNKIKNETGIDLSNASPALREALFSTAVQHGATGGANIFIKSIKNLQATNKSLSERNLIQEVYKERSGRFPSSRPEIRASVLKRLNNEKTDALSMLANNAALLNKKV
jgi:hypothetical protein